MNRVRIDGRELEYEVRGAGEPVVLVHGSHIADAFAPLLAEPTLTERYRLILYHRRGFAGSTHPDGPPQGMAAGLASFFARHPLPERP